MVLDRWPKVTNLVCGPQYTPLRINRAKRCCEILRPDQVHNPRSSDLVACGFGWQTRRGGSD